MLRMANTADLQEAIDWVRGELGHRYQVPFEKRRVQLRTGGAHTFNAVAIDGCVIATVTNSSGATSGGKKPVGKIRGAIAELYFLSLVDAAERLLFATDRDFLTYLERELEGAVTEGIALRHMALPADLAMRVASVTTSASEEMSG